MKINLTEKVIERMICRSKINFYNNSNNSEHKKLLETVPVYIYLSNRMTNTLGMAWCARYYQNKNIIKKLGIKRDDKKVKINGINCFPILQLNKVELQMWESKMAFDIVSHEMAHILDFLIRGYWKNAPERCHDEFWKTIHTQMGGQATRVINVKKYNIDA